MMIVHSAKVLFAWDGLKDGPSLQTIKDLLAASPDGKLLNSLRAARGKGQDDYPVSVLWGVVVLRVALRHTTTEAILAELDPQRRSSPHHRHRVGERRAQQVEHVALRGRARPRAASYAPEGDLQWVDQTPGRLDHPPGPRHRGRRHQAVAAAQAGRGRRERRSTRGCRKPPAAARSTKTTRAR